MVQLQRWKRPGRHASTGSRDGRFSLSLAALAFLSLGALGACGGSGDAGTTGPPPAPPPPPPEPSVTCTESSAESSEGLWQEQPSGVEEGPVGVQFLDAMTGRAVRGTAGGRHPLTLLTTSDGGSTWCRSTISADRTRDLGRVFFIDPDVGFMLGQSCTVMRTEDGGETWSDRRFCDSSHWFLSIAAFDSEWIWLGGDVGGLSRSRDGGVSWEKVTDLPPPNVPVQGFAFFSREVVVFTESLNSGLYRTTDGGETWQRQESPAGPRQWPFDIALANATTAVAVGMNGTIIRTVDWGETWHTVESPVSATLWGVDFGADGFGVAVGEGGTILVSTDAGASWTAEESPVRAELVRASVLDIEHAWVSGAEGVILVRRAQ